MPTTSTIIGYIASGLVLTTFWTNDLRRLRMIAILSNIAFISYGALVWLPPVLGLHLLLLPLNTVRLVRMSDTVPDADRRSLLPSRLATMLGQVRRDVTSVCGDILARGAAPGRIELSPARASRGLVR